jgi:hypothetical protein
MMIRCVLRIPMRWSAVALVVAFPMAVQAEPAIRADYRCLGRFDAVDVTAFFFNRSPAELVLFEGRSSTRLPLLPSADGGRYGEAEQEFWIRGDRASWRRAKGVVMTCQAAAGG